MIQLSQTSGPIGVLDFGYGGLTTLHGIRQLLPEYDYVYLGDNIHAPYGMRSFDVVHEFAQQVVAELFEMGRHLVILGCNTASAKALRTTQQYDLPSLNSNRKVLGVIRPTAGVIGSLTKNRHVGLLVTEGTVRSESYQPEMQKFSPDMRVSSITCPFWVPLVEYNGTDSPGADYSVKKRLDALAQKDPLIGMIILGCTHYPLLMPKVGRYKRPGARIVVQGEYVVNSLKNYLKRHPEMNEKCTKAGSCQYFTTENPIRFQEQAQAFLHRKIQVNHVDLA